MVREIQVIGIYLAIELDNCSPGFLVQQQTSDHWELGAKMAPCYIVGYVQ